MRQRGPTLAVTLVLSLGVGACGGQPPADVPAARPTPATTTASPSPSPSPSRSVAPVDLRLTVPPAPVPPCGFRTGDNTVTMLYVAVKPIRVPGNDAAEADVRFVTDRGDHAQQGYKDGGPKSNYLTDPRWQAFYAPMFVDNWSQNMNRTTTITVTVDPDNKIVESDEQNNVLTLRVKPKRLIRITDTVNFDDFTCTVIP